MRTVWNLDDAEANRLIGLGKTITETARLLGVSRQAVYHAIHMGRVSRDGGPLEDGMQRDSARPSTPCAGGRPNSG